MIETLVVGPLETNCYLVHKNKKCLIIDPGDDADYIERKMSDLGINPVAILTTHGHYDHVLAAYELQQAYGIPFYVHKNDEFLIKNISKSAKYFSRIDYVTSPKKSGYLSNDKKFEKNGISFNLIHVPGHTPGSVALYNKREDIVFVGDLIFSDGNVGRYDFKYSDYISLQNSIDIILSLPEKTYVYSGHGMSSSIKNIKGFYKIL